MLEHLVVIELTLVLRSVFSKQGINNTEDHNI